MTRLTIPIALRWGDQDAYGHVNNVTMLRLLEEARIRAFIFDDTSSEQAPAAALHAGADAEHWTLIGGQQIEYLRPLPYVRDPLRVDVWVGGIGGASLDICYEVRSPTGSADDIVYARAVTTLVVVDAKSGRPTRISPELRDIWSSYLEAPVSFRTRG